MDYSRSPRAVRLRRGGSPYPSTSMQAHDPFIYSAWDGTQELPAFSAGEVLDQLADELLQAGDPRQALRSLLQRGFRLPDGRRFEGLRSLLKQMNRERQKMLGRYDPSGMIDVIRERLDEIIETERDAIDARRSEEGLETRSGTGQENGSASGDTGAETGSHRTAGTDAPTPAAGSQAADGGESGTGCLREVLATMLDRKESQLDRLPADNAGRIRGLHEYEFTSAQAREDFERLFGDLQRRLLQQYAQGLKDGAGSLSPEDLDEMRQMTRNLNAMIESAGQGDREAFDQFMDRWGHNFPPGIETLDDLLSHLQTQMSQVRHLLDSMDEQSRRELMDTMNELLRDDRLQIDLARLASNLRQMGYAPDAGGFPFRGAEAPGFEESLDMMRRLQAMEQFEYALSEDPLGALMDAPEGLTDQSGLFGRHMASQVAAVKDMADSLIEAGYLKGEGGRLELTPRAIRRLGDSALREIFRRLQSDRLGGHQSHWRGRGVDLATSSRPYEFGDPFAVDLPKTVMNGVRRGSRSPVTLAPADFEVYETEHSVRQATVLAIDASRSMFLRGLFSGGQEDGTGPGQPDPRTVSARYASYHRLRRHRHGTEP